MEEDSDLVIDVVKRLKYIGEVWSFNLQIVFLLITKSLRNNERAIISRETLTLF